MPRRRGGAPESVPFKSSVALGPAASWIAVVGALAILGLAAAIMVDVLLRWLFDTPILGVDDLGKFNLAVIVSSFFPVCLIGGHFVTIRFLGRAAGRSGRCARSGSKASAISSPWPSSRCSAGSSSASRFMT